jgi:mono/diheme cytochrome c family protein
MPFYIWEVLPDVCPDKLPGGYASLGFTYEAGKDRPIGISVRTFGVPRMGFNCAACHSGRYRTARGAPATVVLGMEAQHLQFQPYIKFLMGCVTDDRFNPETVMAAIHKRRSLSGTEAAVYRHLLVPGVKKAIQDAKKDVEWFDKRPPFGPGRFDDWNPAKVQLGMDLSHDDSVGVSDFPPNWNQQAKPGHGGNWDANVDNLMENIIGAALATGTAPETVDVEEFRFVEDFIKKLPPARYPFAVDAALAEQGRPIFESNCAKCHAAGGERVGKVTPVDEVGTDRNRLDAFTDALAKGINGKSQAYPWRFSRFAKTSGYANMLLDGVWARAPYLHNGSVPHLRDLLEPPERRTRVFYRGSDVYDPANVGWVSSGPDVEKDGFRLDTSVRGNGNGGHLFGTGLATEEKTALIEYLKTI